MTTLTVALTTVSLASATTSLAAAATPEPGVVLPGLTSVQAMVTDAAAGMVFIGGQGGVVAAPVDGTSPASDVNGAATMTSALATSIDGSTLWVAASDGSVMSFDTAHLEAGPIHFFPAPAGVTCVGGMAAGGDGHVWLAGGDCTATARLAVLDPASGTWSTDEAKTLFGRDLVAPATVAVDPGTGHTLVVGEDGEHARPALLATVDLAGTTPTVISTAKDGFGAYRLAVSPDGTTVTVGRGGQYAQRYATADLADVHERRTFDGTGIDWLAPNSYEIALSGSGQHLATGGLDATTYDSLPSSTSWVRNCAGPFLDHIAWAGDVLFGTHSYSDGMHMLTCQKATAPQSLVVSSTPVDGPIAGEPFVTHLRLLNHAMPVAKASMSVTRIGAHGRTPLAPVTTDSAGRAAFTDTVPTVGMWSYEVAYAGDATREAVTRTYDVFIGIDGSDVSMTAPKSARLDAPITLHLRLTDARSRQALGGKIVHLVRTDSAGRHTLHAVVTDAQGLATIVDHPHIAGTLNYEATFADAGHTFASASRDVVVAHASTAITISTRQKVVGYHAFAAVHIHLGRSTSRLVRVWAYQNGWWRPVAHRKVDAHGDLVVRTRVNRRTTFIVHFDGDRRHAAAAARVLQQVRAKLTVGFADQGSVVHGVTQYHRPSWFELTANVGLNRNHACLYFDRAYIIGGHWYSLGRSSCRRTGNAGTTFMFFDPAKDGRGDVRYAFRAVFKGDRQNAATTTRWVYAQWS